MPMTLEKSAYLHLMKQKGIAESVSSTHFDRIAAMMAKFNASVSHLPLGLFGPVDVGQGVYWWDYGQLKLYLRNTLLVTERYFPIYLTVCVIDTIILILLTL
jgi:hypothetical protein